MVWLRLWTCRLRILGLKRSLTTRRSAMRAQDSCLSVARTCRASSPLWFPTVVVEVWTFDRTESTDGTRPAGSVPHPLGRRVAVGGALAISVFESCVIDRFLASCPFHALSPPALQTAPSFVVAVGSCVLIYGCVVAWRAARLCTHRREGCPLCHCEFYRLYSIVCAWFLTTALLELRFPEQLRGLHPSYRPYWSKFLRL